MQNNEQRGMPTKWMMNIIAVTAGWAVFNGIFFNNCFLSKYSDDIAKGFFIQGGLLCIFVFWIILREYKYMVIDDDVIKRLSNSMMACYLICIFIFGGAVSWLVADSVLDIMILLTSHTLVQFKAAVSDVDTIPGQGRGSCHGVKYTFNNTPIEQNTTICDEQGSFNFLKNNDLVLVKENVGLFGAQIFSEEYAPK